MPTQPRRKPQYPKDKLGFYLQKEFYFRNEAALSGNIKDKHTLVVWKKNEVLRYNTITHNMRIEKLNDAGDMWEKHISNVAHLGTVRNLIYRPEDVVIKREEK